MHFMTLVFSALVRFAACDALSEWKMTQERLFWVFGTTFFYFFFPEVAKDKKGKLDESNIFCGFMQEKRWPSHLFE